MLIISGCSEKEKISCGKENLEWAYCVKEADDIQSAVPPIVWGEYYIQANMQVEGDFKTYIERYCELKKMDIKVYDFESGECIAKWNGKEKLSPYLEEYQMAEEKLETCIYNKKPCLCVFMEEKKIRKYAAEELPQTVFLLEIETGKVLKQMQKEEWIEREDVVEKLEVQLKDLVNPKQLKLILETVGVATAAILFVVVVLDDATIVGVLDDAALAPLAAYIASVAPSFYQWFINSAPKMATCGG